MQPHDAQEAEEEGAAETGQHATGHDAEEPSWPGMSAEARHAPAPAEAQQGFAEEGVMDPEALRRAMQRAMHGQGGPGRTVRPEEFLEGSRPMVDTPGMTRTDTDHGCSSHQQRCPFPRKQGCVPGHCTQSEASSVVIAEAGNFSSASKAAC